MNPKRAVLFVDIVDSTGIYEALGDEQALAVINLLFGAFTTKLMPGAEVPAPPEVSEQPATTDTVVTVMGEPASLTSVGRRRHLVVAAACTLGVGLVAVLSGEVVLFLG